MQTYQGQAGSSEFLGEKLNSVLDLGQLESELIEHIGKTVVYGFQRHAQAVALLQKVGNVAHGGIRVADFIVDGMHAPWQRFALAAQASKRAARLRGQGDNRYGASSDRKWIHRKRASV